ncbi:MAG: putative lipid II flippase FtsW [Alphaproteobacteria bacterium]|jgi:cell division protein FtsW|uniref:Probable peptidoglycan glycosyltransferase FtsW n=1 Tax=Brevundimonas mediterranea TaxID=74329 RepID=A0AB37E926_9CAUL|nr:MULTISPECIES: putative peptidoglycan glycosyltransferase FtsW [Brevundimonas]MBU1521062.1 putative lipid II flippase FtsW [Alphaproteobacteria bacterium]OGN47433.1 MAG: cell division protein FtsW [Caulobacterales bacterium RIFCSPHIGHO2_12_FULL_68_13]OGN51004.1 MAG: cell division protein FtsW [Caulobacterales bacterium RIFCSPHIGHO2_01_FULL_67_30]OYX81080.1 MAG: cell division protein FtsW [Brevundimonas sp. 32-68-21]EDX80996.1 cell division protein FtsW [Brevundimonas sp. BAL3]
MSASYTPAFSRNDQSPVAQWFWTVDRGLLGAALALMGLGVALSFASSPAAILADESITDPFHYSWRMMVFSGAGLTLMLTSSLLSPRGVRRIAVLALFGAIVVMMALPFIGDTVKGAARWVNFGPFSLQPSEFAKPGLIVFAAWMFAEAQKGQGVPGVTIAFGFYALTVCLLLIQPDIGQTLLITTTFMAVFFMAGVPFKWMAVLASAGMAGLVSLYFVFGHMRDRLSRFFSPETTDTHQIDSAAEAIRAGGLVGRGIGEGVMKRHVPDLHTDFIYSVGAEEFGLVLSLTMISLYAFIVVRGMRRAMKLTDPFEQTAAAGLFMLIGLQACINVAVNLNLIPTKGMTLPFISYGGSSMLAMGLTMGFALALTRRRPGAYEPGASLSRPGRRLL